MFMYVNHTYVLCFIDSSQCQHEHFRLHVNEVDLFIGIEQQKIDVKYPLPTRLAATFMLYIYMYIIM